MADLQFNVTDCETVNITTPNTLDDLNLIAEMQESPQTSSQNIRRYSVEYGKNCCPDITIKLPVFYNFVFANTDCEEVGPPPLHYDYTFSITGMNAFFIDTLQSSRDNINYSTQSYSNVTNGFTYVLRYTEAEVTLILGSEQNYDHYIRITHVDGFIYTLRLRFRLQDPGECNVISTTLVSVVYPEFDERVSITDDAIDIPTLYEVEDSLETGVYRVIICRWYLSTPTNQNSLASNCVQDSHFIECGIECELVNKLVQCKDTNIFTYYRALQFSNDCDTPYQDQCDLYELMTNKLDNPGCDDPYDDCNCQDSKTDFFKQRGYNNNKAVTRRCTTC